MRDLAAGAITLRQWAASGNRGPVAFFRLGQLAIDMGASGWGSACGL